MMPNTSVSPAAIRNSMMPSCSPLSAWTARSCASITAARAACRAPSLQRAVLGVGVGLRGHHRAAAELQQLAVLAHGFVEVVVLDREAVVVELERPAHRLDVGLAERRLQPRLVV